MLAPVVIDFEGIPLAGDDPTLGGVQQHSEDGFTLVDPNNTDPRAFIFWRPAADPFLNTVALFNGTNGVTRLTQDNGLPFGFNSIALSEDQRRMEAPEWIVTFTGVRADGSSVSETFVLDGVFGFQTFLPVGFTEILSLDWSGSLPVQFDNLVLVP